MIQHDLKPGTPEWHAHRRNHFNASDAPAMLGISPYKTRDQLLHEYATGEVPEIDAATQARFDDGHRFEALARPLAENQIGEDLFPVVGSDGKLSASFDGLTLADDIVWEHKTLNDAIRACGSVYNLPEIYRVQMDQQMLVSGATKAMFHATRWEKEDGSHYQREHRGGYVLMEEVSFWYEPDHALRQRIIAGWEQFERDLAEFKPTEKVIEAVGTQPKALPSLNVDVRGEVVVINNIGEFREAARIEIENRTKMVLVTDQDFADAEATIKWLADKEKQIDLIKQQIAQKAAIEDVLNALNEVQQNMMRENRLRMSKLVEARKTNRRNEIVADAATAFASFLALANAEFAASKVSIASVHPDFYAAIKGKRSFSLMISACNDLIAHCKIMVSEVAAKYRGNLALIAQHPEHDFLFSGDRQQLADMSADHLALTINSRIGDYKAKQEADETARVQRHKNAIAGIEAAGDFDDTLPLQALLTTRKRIADIDTGALQEFAIKGEQMRTATLTKLDERIKALQEQIAAETAARKAAAATPAPMAEQSPAAVVAPAPVREAAAPVPTIGLADVKQRRPSDREIVDVLTLHYRVHDSVVLGWLLEFDHEAAGNDLAVNF